ncbi:interleukin-1 receptor accessory protein-like 1-B [Nilaparvata lugens]|uniref:interleukin-1 receptor accessory protein-like 1-B n=1 Tax=Nilaparvata lugens TaxID=108931 RepID=UPI00193D467E|nr:interleukin-1 receptor accessory protein-like 1-B [Nilaparvata lugens]
MSGKLWFFVIFVTFVVVQDSKAALEKYCSENRIRTLGNLLEFAKELSSAEYAVSNMTTKALYCCAKGYRSIEWFKDDRPYPWTQGVSSLILNPDSANQSVYTQRLTQEDAGVYTCRATNDTHLIEHHIRLTVFQSSSYVDEPKPTYKVPEAHFAKIDEPARLYCEAFVGKSDLPDEINTITWMRPGINMTELLAEERINTTEIYRDQLQIIGSYFLIDKVKFSDFGDYFCTISNSDDQFLTVNTSLREINKSSRRERSEFPFWMRLMLVVVAGLMYIICTFDNQIAKFLFITYYTVANFFRRHFRSYNNSVDRKDYDVMVSYKQPDKEFAVDIIAAKLTTEYNYKVICKELTDPTIKSTSCNSIILVLSPATFDNQWTLPLISKAVKQVYPIIKKPVIVIPSKPLPNEKTVETVDTFQRLKQVEAVNGPRAVNGKMRFFWAKLTYVLPLAQPQQGYTASATNSTNKITMQRTGSNNANRGGILV